MSGRRSLGWDRWGMRRWPAPVIPAAAPQCALAVVPGPVHPAFLEIYRIAYERAVEAARPTPYERLTAPCWN